jgi:flagellar hook-basal body protein
VTFTSPLAEKLAPDLLERFQRYVRIDTQSTRERTQSPSTPGQLELSRLLVEELTAIGLTDAALDEHGYVTATLPGTSQPSTLGQLQLAGFPNPQGLDPKGGNIYAETAASGAPSAAAPGSNGLGRIQQGFVETSNVNVVEELVQMIQTQRAYELNSKAVQTSDQMLQKLAQI